MTLVVRGEQTVPCKDTQYYGVGKLEARICAHGQTVTCAFETYKEPATNGTCTL